MNLFVGMFLSIKSRVRKIRGFVGLYAILTASVLLFAVCYKYVKPLASFGMVGLDWML